MPTLRTRKHEAERTNAPTKVNGVASSGLPRAPAIAPPGRRRRPRWAVVGVAVVVLGALVGAWLVSVSSDRVAVVGIAQPVAFGETIEAGDLRQVQALPDPGLEPVLYADVDAVIGRVAATDLVPGSLLTEAALAGEPVPGTGEELVPIALAASRLPATGLRPRDEVLLVPTAAEPGQVGTDPAAGSGVGEEFTGTVLRVGETGSTGLVVVDVLVEAGEGARLAQLAADGQIALVVLPRAG